MAPRQMTRKKAELLLQPLGSQAKARINRRKQDAVSRPAIGLVGEPQTVAVSPRVFDDIGPAQLHSSPLRSRRNPTAAKDKAYMRPRRRMIKPFSFLFLTKFLTSCHVARPHDNFRAAARHTIAGLLMI